MNLILWQTKYKFAWRKLNFKFAGDNHYVYIIRSKVKGARTMKHYVV